MTSAIRAQREAEDGFTLIELLVVVIIIGILAAIAIPAFLNQRENAWTSSVESDLRNAAIEMESEATQNNGTYPALADITIQTSDDVTIAEGSNTGTAFCLTGAHANVDGGAVIRIYDSASGGLTAAAACP